MRFDGYVNTWDDVLMFDIKNSEWKKIGDMQSARFGHGASLVNMGDVISFCR